jgi:hypothetical protein
VHPREETLVAAAGFLPGSTAGRGVLRAVLGKSGAADARGFQTSVEKGRLKRGGRRLELELELELEDGTRIATPPFPADLALGLLARVACYG